MNWNYRLVRRYLGFHATYIELAAVSYVNGRPHAVVCPPPPAGRTEADNVAAMKERVRHQLFAFDRPILDERGDFHGNQAGAGVQDCQGEAAGRADHDREGATARVVRLGSHRAKKARRAS